MIISELNGIGPIAKLLSSPDAKIKANAEILLYKIGRLGKILPFNADKNQGYIREAGVIPLLMANVSLNSSNGVPAYSSSEALIVSNAALAFSTLGRNEMNQNDLIKGGTIDVLLKLLATDNIDIKKQALLALSTLAASGKQRD
jgi:hypothetical protein